ncbi:MAG: membrane protein insertion efficiency factor YidD [Oscillospiraceae bacterium]|jgi:putative membrane protein insertion efficiency factor|nr:membrane protein insertion efficiency factor YidD [Oscillospiraceae bacterium]
MKQVFLSAIRFYQRRVSPLFPPMCRYYPTCSQYAAEAIEVHGVLRGGLLAVYRLMRCNIFSPGGVDPVPPKRK